MERIRWPEVDRIIELALAEDLGSGDITTLATVAPATQGTAQIVSRRPAVVAGLFLAGRIYARIDERVRCEPLVKEGSRVAAGTVICRFEGPFQPLLAGERTVLNFLQRLCGIASLTARFVAATRGKPARIYDTRKTAPGMRELEKYAVRAGGGCNHRFGLFDAILIKENHIEAAGGVDKAIRRARKALPDRRLEIEVRTIEELVLAVEYGADIVLLDNMSPADIRKAVVLVGERVELEVSGGVDLRQARLLAGSGVHRISVGALTHSAPATDLSMLILRSRGNGK